MAGKRVYPFGIGSPSYNKKHKVSSLGVPRGGGPSKRKLKAIMPQTIRFTSRGGQRRDRLGRFA